MDEFDEKAREIYEQMNSAALNVGWWSIAQALRDTHNAALEKAAARANDHERFCRREANNGGSSDLYERAAGASYLAKQARALKKQEA